MALLAQTGAFAAEALRDALETTFAFRATHDLPGPLPPPPAAWAAPYARTARLDDLPWKTLDEVFTAVTAFLDPVLSAFGGEWSPANWAWS